MYILDKSSRMYRTFGTVTQIEKMDGKMFALVYGRDQKLERWFSTKYLATMKDVEEAKKNDWN